MFIEEHLKELRRAGYGPRAWREYMRSTSRTIREHLDANPGAVRSLWNLALLFFAGAFVVGGALALTLDRRLAVDVFLATALWMVPVFALVSCGIGLLRDRDGYSLSAVNLPIALTMLRASLVPSLVIFVLERHLSLALITFLVAVLSDVADGWVARRWRQQTPLGTVIDPIVDIVLSLAVFFALAASQLVPIWVFWIAALRYGVLIAGGICLYLFAGPVRIHPTLFGRLTGVLASVLVAILVCLRMLGGAVEERLMPLTETALGVLLGLTVVHVVVLGWFNVRLTTGAIAETRGRVVGDVRDA